MGGQLVLRGTPDPRTSCPRTTCPADNFRGGRSCAATTGQIRDQQLADGHYVGGDRQALVGKPASSAPDVEADQEAVPVPPLGQPRPETGRGRVAG